jgi:hypothetical protein
MDGKIYVVPNNSVYHINYIESPDVKGSGCNFVQHGLEFPNLFVLATPVHPNYRLGALEGSPCDTLTVGVAEAPKPSSEFRLYPNPAQGQVVLELPAEWTRVDAVQYRLYNALGALAHSGTAAEGTETVFVPLTGLPDGLYVCQVLRDGRVLGTTKLSIVKN